MDDFFKSCEKGGCESLEKKQVKVKGARLMEYSA